MGVMTWTQWNEYNWKATWGGKFEAYHHQAPARKKHARPSNEYT